MRDLSQPPRQEITSRDRHDSVLIFHVWPARRKAIDVATTEALCLFNDLAPTAPRGGPLAEQRGLFWIELPSSAIEIARHRFAHLGYTAAIDLVAPLSKGRSDLVQQDDSIVRWRGTQHQLIRLYAEDADALRNQAPDRRTFLLELQTGEIRAITGYRGDGGPLSRRGLPVLDARLLVNLVFMPDKGTFLDPFAGIGGIVLEAVRSGWHVLSADIDPALRPGLTAFGASHAIVDAVSLPYPSASVDVIATEPPYDQQVEPNVEHFLCEMVRVLRPGGKLAQLCVPWQANILRHAAPALGLSVFLDAPVNRKGLDVVVLAWQKE